MIEIYRAELRLQLVAGHIYFAELNSGIETFEKSGTFKTNCSNFENFDQFQSIL